MRGVGRNERWRSNQHPSSDLASLGHLLPQGEKVEAAMLHYSENSSDWMLCCAAISSASAYRLGFGIGH
jgi:hypothetical protein